MSFCVKFATKITKICNIAQNRCHLWATGLRLEKNDLAADGFDPSTSGLWAQHASTAPRCCGGREGKLPNVDEKKGGEKKKPAFFLEGKKKGSAQ